MLKYAKKTKLLSISGDSSDPSLINKTKYLANEAKLINPFIKVNIHTRTLNYVLINDFINNNYDKIVISIDENFFNNISKQTNTLLISLKDKIRFSIVITNYNIELLNKDFIIKLYSLYPNASFTIRPDVFNKNDNFERQIYLLIKTLSPQGFIENKLGAIVLNKYKNIWFWFYKKSNKINNVKYLFSNDVISNYTIWEELY